ncbi:HEPHL-like protein [Mya arenaria]|uniref:HEPHL-like protein n=1 Tax=Mya arenaria TaxID=6604 RepID=A0ABY7FHG4_MYAAR|nr:HEPHL-like protein [Mya arenaria]WAR20237.1 HEPHL-like protein [Mya arenaria]
MASKGNFSIHPHGDFYDKRGEGARYEDRTSGADKRHTPTADDDACVPLGYHGHANPTRDIASGLAGIRLICKKGLWLISSQYTKYAYYLNKNIFLINMIPFAVHTCLARLMPIKNVKMSTRSSLYTPISLTKTRAFSLKKAFKNADNQMLARQGLFRTIKRNAPYQWLCLRQLAPIQIESRRSSGFLRHVIESCEPDHENKWTYHDYKAQANRERIGQLGEFSQRIHSGLSSWPLASLLPKPRPCKGMLAFVDVSNKPVPSEIVGPSQSHGRIRKYYLAIEEIIWDYAPGLTPDK